MKDRQDVTKEVRMVREEFMKRSDLDHRVSWTHFRVVSTY
jgi:hypothetical protein